MHYKASPAISYRQALAGLFLVLLYTGTGHSAPAASNTGSKATEEEVKSALARDAGEAPSSWSSGTKLTLEALDEASTATVSLDLEDPWNSDSFIAELKSSLYELESGEAGDLSLAEATRIAILANPTWAIYAASHEAAHAELVRACAFPNPELDVEFGRERPRERSNGAGSAANTWSLALAQPIEMPGKRLARELEAEAGFAVVAGEAREFESLLRADVAEAYWTVQYHASMERLHESLLRLASQLEQIALDRFELGESGRAETLNSRVEVLRAKRDRDSARHRREGARAALVALAGGRLGRNCRLSDPLLAQTRSISLEKSVDAALNCHPRLLRLAAELEQNYAGIDKERTAWWPDIKLGVRKSREFDTDAVAATVGVELPLWNRNQGGIARARANASKTHADIHVAFNEIRRDVESAWHSFQAARSQVKIYGMPEGLRAAAGEAVAVSWLEYKVGVAGYLDVLSARRVLQETEQGYLQALLDSAVARASFERAVGIPTTAAGRMKR